MAIEQTDELLADHAGGAQHSYVDRVCRHSALSSQLSALSGLLSAGTVADLAVRKHHSNKKPRRLVRGRRGCSGALESWISAHRRAQTADLPGRLTRFRSDEHFIVWNIVGAKL
jgi:hypothetical protein